MLFKLICLIHEGVQLTKPELAASEKFVGNLVIHDWQAGNAFCRAVRRARLLTTQHPDGVDLLPPLFEPVIIKMTRDQFQLHGYQIHTRQQQAVHYAQTWVLRAVD